MKKLFACALLFIGYQLHAQDLTGTWEGEFVKGNVGLRQPAKMVLEIVEVEGKLYGIFDLYPIDTRKNDKPNISYTVEGNCKPETIKFSLIQGRVIDGFAAEGKTPPFHQFIFERKSKDGSDLLSGKWFRQLEPLNTLERGGGTFIVKRVSAEVSNRLKLPMQEKKVLQKIEQQTGR
ncbi:MAG: hypothetical protein WCF67_17735 [Chitinophagaceae bacterium]